MNSFARRVAAPRVSALPVVVSLLVFAVLTSVATSVRAALPIEHWTTSSGARVYFVRADAIPILDINVDFDAGARLVPADKTGLASLTNSMLARGTEDLDEAQIAEGFARLGAQRGGGAGDDRAGVTLRTLGSEKVSDAAVALLAKILERPSFPESVLAREKERSIQAIREAETRPATIAQWTFDALLYGDHPYGAHATAATIAAISRDDLVEFHRSRYGASQAVVSMIGAIDRKRAEAIAEMLTGGLPAGTAPPPVPDVAALRESQQRRIAHPASQSHILIGQPAIARGDPDYFPLLVGNYVLGGGGFVSRLYDEVREKRGLAYSVYSYFSPKLQPGPFTIGLQTQKEQTEIALGVVRETLSRFLDEGPSGDELKAAKSNLIGGFALRIDSNRKILENLAVIGFYRLPLDYLDRWTDRVDAVTLEQVRDAFTRRVRPETMITVVVGADSDVAR